MAHLFVILVILSYSTNFLTGFLWLMKKANLVTHESKTVKRATELLGFNTSGLLSSMAKNVRQYIIIHLFKGAFWIDYRSIWCRYFTIICITKKLEVKMSPYTSFISDVHKSYRVEKLVLHHLIFLLIKISKC